MYRTAIFIKRSCNAFIVVYLHEHALCLPHVSQKREKVGHARARVFLQKEHPTIGSEPIVTSSVDASLQELVEGFLLLFFQATVARFDSVCFPRSSPTIHGTLHVRLHLTRL